MTTQIKSDTLSYFRAHALECRLRLIYVCASAVLCFFSCYFCSPQLIYWLVKPVGYSIPGSESINSQRFCSSAPCETGEIPAVDFSPSGLIIPYAGPRAEFISTHITEAFYATLQVSAAITLPSMLIALAYQYWCFRVPGQYSRERRASQKQMVGTCALVLSALFVIMVYLLPNMYAFFCSFGVHLDLVQVRLEARIAPYLSWVLLSSAVFLGLSGIPLLILFFLRHRIITLDLIVKNRQISAFFILLVSAFFSPPDVLAQLVISSSAFVLLECSIYLHLYKMHQVCSTGRSAKAV